MLALVGSDPGDWKGTHIQFEQYAYLKPKAKTFVWLVWTKDGSGKLGEVRWFSRWRKYCFFPEPECVFEETCLRDISDFIVQMTLDHKLGV